MRRIHFRRTDGNRTRKTTSLNGSNTVTNYVYDADGNLTLRSRESFGTETEASGFDLASASPSIDGFTNYEITPKPKKIVLHI